MAAIQFTDRGVPIRLDSRSRALARATVAALAAPSLLNTQPWRWRIAGDVAELRADRDRQVFPLDPHGRLLTLSYGVALHHARVALAADGVHAEITLLPDLADPDLLATVRYAGSADPTPMAHRLRRAMTIRHTDRRPFADRPMPLTALETLQAAAEAEGARWRLPQPRELVALTVAASRAAVAELADPAYRAVLAEWVRRGCGDEGEGVPPATTVPMAARPVSVREFTATGPEPTTLRDPLLLADRFACYTVLFTDGDQPVDWLSAGQALSAVLLTATAEGLATSPMSDLVEVAESRALLADVLGGSGYPQIVVRIGVPAPGAPVAAPRRVPADMVELTGEPEE